VSIIPTVISTYQSSVNVLSLFTICLLACCCIGRRQRLSCVGISTAELQPRFLEADGIKAVWHLTPERVNGGPVVVDDDNVM
jgi:hypothetical protein